MSKTVLAVAIHLKAGTPGPQAVVGIHVVDGQPLVVGAQLSQRLHAPDRHRVDDEGHRLQPSAMTRQIAQAPRVDKLHALASEPRGEVLWNRGNGSRRSCRKQLSDRIVLEEGLQGRHIRVLVQKHHAVQLRMCHAQPLHRAVVGASKPACVVVDQQFHIAVSAQAMQLIHALQGDRGIHPVVNHHHLVHRGQKCRYDRCLNGLPVEDGPDSG